jgi:hypothetical protein
VLFLNVMRREFARATLRWIATDLAVRRAASRRGHLRNGVGALLAASSEIAWRPTPLVSLFYVTRPRVRAQLNYGVAELATALSPPAVLRRHRTLAGASASAVLVGLAVVRARHHGDGEPDEAPVLETI